MSLRQQAATDAQTILEDTAGFGWSITVTDPAGTQAALTGFSNDIALTIDPETGQPVSGRVASVALAMASLTAAGFTTLPQGIADTGGRPWVIQFNDIRGTSHKFKVRQSIPDRAIGIVVCILEAYQ